MRWRSLLLIGLMMAFASSSHAQAVGQCVTGTAIGFLENTHLRASVFNTGGLFFGGSTTSGDGYLIPKSEEASTLFAVSFNLGGIVDGELRTAAGRYGGYDFWPGRLEDATSPPTDCSEQDRIYVVSREDIARFYTTGKLAPDLADWPHQLGAPVLDGDGDSTNYDLRAGDQPDLIGDVAAWWVMNDAGNDHNPGSPLGVEVQVHAFVYGQVGEILSRALSQTSFYRYEIINRGETTIDSMYAMLYVDADVGDASDDYMGTDTLRNMIFAYNDSNEDASYGSAPPAQGIQLLQGAIGLANGRDDDFDGVVDEPGERQGAISSAPCEITLQCPGTDEEYFYYMQGLWADGRFQCEGGFGYCTPERPISRFWFTGDPVTRSFWSAMNIDGAGSLAPSGDYRMMMSTGPFRLTPGESTTLFYAFPYGRGSNYLESVAVVRAYAAVLQNAFSEGVFVSRPVERGAGVSPFELALSLVRPNPSRQPEALLTLPEEAHVRAAVYDALGRQLEVIANSELAEGETVLQIPDGLAPGTYLLRVRVAPGGDATLTFTVVR